MGVLRKVADELDEFSTARQARPDRNQTLPLSFGGQFRGTASIAGYERSRRQSTTLALHQARRIARDAGCWLDFAGRIRGDRRPRGARPHRHQENQHGHDRVGIHRIPRVRAAARVRRAGQRQEGRLRRAERQRREGFRRLLGEASRATRCCGTSRSRGRSTNRTRRSTSGSTTASSTSPTTASTATSQNGNADKVAIIFEADDGAVTKVTYRELYHRVCRLANGLKSLGIKKGDRVLDLHADVDRGRGRDAGLRAHRRDAFGGVRRILGQVAAGAHHRRRRGRGDHRRRAGARRQAPAAEGDRRRGARHGRLRGHPQRDRLPAHRRQDRLHRAARPLAARARREAGRHLRAGMGRRRASAVHPLHVGIDRQAEGRAAQLRRLPAVGDADDALGVRHQADRRLLVHRRHRLGHRPHVHRVRPARGRRDRSRVRGHPDLSRRGPLLEDDREAQGLDLLHRADGDPLAGQGVRRDARDARRRTTTCRACACSARSASRSIRKRGCGTTTTSAAAAARSSTPGGRPKPAAT